MSTPTNYSNDEIATLVGVIPNLISAVIDVDGVRAIGIFRQLGAVVSYMRESQQKFSGNALVQAVIEQYTAQGDSGEQAQMPPTDIATIVGKINSVLKDDADGKGFREFLYEITERVAGATGKGLFGTGQKVTEKEEQTLQTLKQQLGL